MKGNGGSRSGGGRKLVSRVVLVKHSVKTHGAVATGHVKNGATGANGDSRTVGTQRNVEVVTLMMMVTVVVPIAAVKLAG